VSSNAPHARRPPERAPSEKPRASARRGRAEESSEASPGRRAARAGAKGDPALLKELHREHAPFLWGLSYRLTGSAADADDLVQETFVRALERPPPDTTEPMRPWLARVALNLGRDLLRRRRRRRYVGPWLPSPIETGEDATLAGYEPVLAGERTTEGRYDLVESVSMAFLLALEVLTPKQRAVLLLRDVFDYSVAETASALDVSESDVKVTLHRARRALEAYDRERCIPTNELRARSRAALESLVGALATGDMRSAEKLLADSATALTDGGGEFFAARKPIVGRERVLRFYRNIGKARLPHSTFEIRTINGLPALVGIFSDRARGQPPRLVQQLVLDKEGRVRSLLSFVATAKLTAIRFPGARALR